MTSSTNNFLSLGDHDGNGGDNIDMGRSGCQYHGSMAAPARRQWHVSDTFSGLRTTRERRRGCFMLLCLSQAMHGDGMENCTTKRFSD